MDSKKTSSRFESRCEDAGPSKISRFLKACAGFSILEMLVSTVILTVLMGLLFTVLNSGTKIWTTGTSKIQSFQEARAAYEVMTRKIGQATLNVYLDYSTNSSGDPIGYKRQSELQFLSGPTSDLLNSSATNQTHAIFFMAPLGYTTNTSYNQLRSLLNASGFFLEFGSDQSDRPAFVNGKVTERHRWRLKELWQPTENVTIYTNSINWTNSRSDGWFRSALTDANKATVAENIIALVIRPRLPEKEDSSGNALLSSGFVYNSKDAFMSNTFNQLPPLVQVVMVAIDERSATRFANGSTAPNYGVANFSALFTNPADFDKDLKAIEDGLISNNVTYQIFNSTVPIEGAKWSR